MADFWSGFAQGFTPAYQRSADRRHLLADRSLSRQQRLDDILAAQKRQDQLLAEQRKRDDRLLAEQIKRQEQEATRADIKRMQKEHTDKIRYQEDRDFRIAGRDVQAGQFKQQEARLSGAAEATRAAAKLKSEEAKELVRRGHVATVGAASPEIQAKVLPKGGGMFPSIGDIPWTEDELATAAAKTIRLQEPESAREKSAATEEGRMSVQPTEDEALEAKFKLEKALVRIGLGLPIDASDEDVQAAKASDQGLPYKPVLTTDQFGFGKQIVIVPTGKGRITNEHVQQAKDDLQAVKGLSMNLGKSFIKEIGIGGDKDKSKSDTVTPEKKEAPMKSEPSDSSLVTPFSDMDKSTAERSRSLKIGEQIQAGEESYERVPEGLKLIKEAPPLPLEPIPPLPSGEPLPPPPVDPLPPSPTSNREIQELDKSLIIAKREYAELYKKMMASPAKKMTGTGEYEKAQALQKEILDLEAKIRGLKSNR